MSWTTSASGAISLPGELKRERDRWSRRDGVTRSDMVREALRDYFAVREFRRLRARTLPYAEAKGIFTDEDVFRIVS